MKFLIKLIILVFVLFQFSSTIIYLIENEEGKSFSIDLVDEDQGNSKETKEVKEFKTYYIICNNKLNELTLSNSSIEVLSSYLLKKYKVSASIFIPPPKEI